MTPTASRADTWLWKVLELVPVGVTMTDQHGRILFTNPAEAVMHGYTPEELLGRPAGGFAPAVRQKPLTLDALAAVTLWERETVNCRRDGTEFPVRLRSDVVRDRQGRPTGLVTVTEDLTVEKLAAEHARQSQKLQMLGQLAGGLAHDFNNVLTVILANLDFLDRTLAREDEADAVLLETHRVARRASGLARQLLAFSRPKGIAVVPTDLRAVLPDSLKVLRRLLPAHIAIEWSAEDDLPVVHADPSVFEEILFNLATNARDAMPTGGTLSVAAQVAVMDQAFRETHPWGRLGDYVTVTVRDTGGGMVPEVIARAFDPFFSTKSSDQGTGLGLSMVYALMKQQRGFVDVASTAGMGTTVRLWFPLTATRRSSGGIPQIGTEAVGGTEAILVVDDEPELRNVLERTLRHFGYVVQVAPDIAEAWKHLTEGPRPFDLVISDIMMPNGSGVDLLNRVRTTLARDIPFLFVSGYSDVDLERMIGGELGVPLLRKPWTVPELTETVRLALRGVGTSLQSGTT